MIKHAVLRVLRSAFGIATLCATADSAAADQLTGATLAPNWALGAPQTPFIGLCNDNDPIRCFGHFGLGPLSDVLDIYWAGTRATVEASFTENLPRLFVFGRLESGAEAAVANDWWNLTVPNAVWAGSIEYAFHDGDDPAGTFGDILAFANAGGLAHIYWWSNNSDNPTPPGPPGDFPAQSFFDVFTEITLPGGTFNPPNANPCNPADPNLTGSSTATTLCQQLDIAALAQGPLLPTFVPEPGSLAILGTALAGFTWLRRRRKPTSGI